MFSPAGVLTLTLAIQAAQPAPAAAPAANTAPRDQPIIRFFQNLGGDLMRLPSAENAIMAAGGVTTALAIRPADDNLSLWAERTGTSGYTAMGRASGDGWAQAGLALGTYGLGWLYKSPQAIHLGSDLIRAQALNGLLTRGFKLAAQRQRPGGTSDSLPSGHTSASFATAAVLHGHYGWRAGVPAYAGASFIAWTRVRDRAHWLSDVVIGATVGAIAGRTVTRGHQPATWAVTPVAGTQTVGIIVTRQVPF